MEARISNVNPSAILGDSLYTYLSKGVYPSDYGTNKKRILRRKAENFRSDNYCELLYVGGKKGDKPRGVIKTEEERRRIWETAMDKTEGIFCYFCTVLMQHPYKP